MKSYVNSFYKPRQNNEADQIIQEKIKHDQIIEYEVQQSLNILNNRIPEILNEANEIAKIANTEIFKNVNIQLSNISTKK